MSRALRVVAALPLSCCLLATSCFVLDRADAIEDGTIAGTMTFADRGVVGGVVSVLDNQRSVRSEAGGAFVLRGLDAGNVGVRLFHDVDNDGTADRGAVRRVLLERGTFVSDAAGNRVERVFGVDLGTVVLEDAVTVRGFVRDDDADSDPLTSTVVVVRPGFGAAAESTVVPRVVEGSPQFAAKVVPGVVQIVALGRVRGRSSDVETVEVALFDDADRPTLTVKDQPDVQVAVTMPSAPPRSRVVIVAAGAPRPAPSTPGEALSAFAPVPVGIADAWVLAENGTAIGVLRNQVALPGDDQTWGPVLPCAGNACGDAIVDPVIDVDEALAIIEGVKIRALFRPTDSEILVSYDRPELRAIDARLRCDDERSQPGMLVNDNVAPFTLRVGTFDGAPPTPMSPVTCAMCVPDGDGEACVDDVVQVFFADGVYLGPDGGAQGELLGLEPAEWLQGVVPSIEAFSSGAAQLVIAEEASARVATDLSLGALDVRGSLQIAGAEQHLTVTDLLATSTVGPREVRGAGRIRLRGEGRLAVNLVDTVVFVGADDPDDPDDVAEAASVTVGHAAGVHIDNSVVAIGDLGSVDLPAVLDPRVPVVDNAPILLRNDAKLDGSSASTFSTAVDLLIEDSDISLLGTVAFSESGIAARYEAPHTIDFEDATLTSIAVESATTPTITLNGVLFVSQFRSASLTGGNGATFVSGSSMTVGTIDVPGFISGELEVLGGASGHLQQMRVTTGNTVSVLGPLQVGSLDVDAGGTLLLGNDVGAVVTTGERTEVFGTIEFGAGAHLITPGIDVTASGRLRLLDDGILEVGSGAAGTAFINVVTADGIEPGGGAHVFRIAADARLEGAPVVAIDDLEVVAGVTFTVGISELSGKTATVGAGGALLGIVNFTTCNNCGSF